MYLPSVERLCVEGHCGRVAALDTVDGDFAPQLHPGHSEDGAGVGTGQCEDVLLVVLEEIKDSYGEKETELLKSVRQDMMRAATRIFVIIVKVVDDYIEHSQRFLAMRAAYWRVTPFKCQAVLNFFYDSYEIICP